MNDRQHPRVTIDGVDVIVEGTYLLRDITWRLGPGERWGIVGANASGKSSLLRLIAGTLWPAPGKGSRTYDFGRGPQHDAVQARAEIVLVGHELQDLYTRFGWNFTALGVVLSGVYRTDVPRRDPAAAETARARAAMHELGLEHLAGRRFLELSRGQQRRVLIARGHAFAPAVLLLDEPASGLDAAARAALAELVDRIGRATPLVCAVHDESHLPPVVNRVAELEGGRIVRVGPRRAQAPAVPRASLAAAQTPAASDPVPVSSMPAAVPKLRSGPLIDVSRASVWLGERRVLADVSWQLREGQHWLVRGANGAGKSSFLRLLHGQLRPARGGRIAWAGLGAPVDVWRLRRRVALISAELQAGYLYPSTVQQSIASGFTASIGQTRALSRTEAARVDELVAAFALEGLEQRRLSTLSYGQRRRALIARALASRPRVLLLDEPWEGLDPATARLVQARIAAAVAEGAHLVCASHGEEPARPFTHELVFEDGRVAAARRLPAAAQAAGAEEGTAEAEEPLRRSRGDASGARCGSSDNAPPRGSGSRAR